MSFQIGRVTLSQLLTTPIVPRTQAPPAQGATALATNAAPLVTMAVATPTYETRARRKRLRWASSNQSEKMLDFKNSPPNLGDSHVNPVNAPTYVKTFIVDGEVVSATDRVRSWREGCVGKALLLQDDMNHWAKWDDNSFLLNIKREAIMVIHFPFVFLPIFFF